MNKQSSKLVILIAMLLLAAKGNAQVVDNPSDEKVRSALSKIQQSAGNDPDLLGLYSVMQKSLLENELGAELTDEEFATIQGLIGQLLTEGVALEPVPVGKMILASQEIGSGT